MFRGMLGRIDLRAASPNLSRRFTKARAYLNTATNTTGGGGWQKIPIDTVEFDEDKIFDSTNKWFKIKRFGVYVINYRLCLDSQPQLFAGAIYVNGANVCQASSDRAGGGQNCVGGALMYPLNEGDYVEAWAPANSGYALRTSATTGLPATWLELLGPF